MMPSASTDIPHGNKLLDALPAADRAALVPHLDAERLEMKQVLFEPGKPLDHVYFPVTAVGSLLNLVDDAIGGVEVATVGNEGLLGLPASWGITTFNPSELAQCQVPGEAVVMDSETFAAKVAAGGGFTEVVHRYSHAFVTQISQQVACNGLHSIEERCARWLLLTSDRVGTQESFPLTQEFLAQMLGVRRASVTVVAGILRQAGLIHFRRGRITITDRQGLESVSCECYRVLREVFDRLFG
jgi:CRP-like cAMP-binding protein